MTKTLLSAKIQPDQFFLPNKELSLQVNQKVFVEFSLPLTNLSYSTSYVSPTHTQINLTNDDQHDYCIVLPTPQINDLLTQI